MSATKIVRLEAGALWHPNETPLPREMMVVLPASDFDRMVELLAAYCGDDPDAQYYERGIGTNTPRGMRWLAARTFLREVGRS